MAQRIGEPTQKMINIASLYDPNSGRFVRPMKATRSFALANASTIIYSINVPIASTVVGTNQNIFITGMSAVALTDTSTCPKQFALCDGNSTITFIACMCSTAATGQALLHNYMTTSYDSPIWVSLGSGAASGTRTISIVAVNQNVATTQSGTCTVGASIWGRIEPIITKSEV